MLSRALTTSLPSLALLTKQAMSRASHTTLLRQTATYAIRLPPMSYQSLPYLEAPRRVSPAEAAAETMASGKLVSDQVVAAMLESYFRTSARDGWVLDGFPRNARQAEMLVSRPETTPDMVIELVVSHDDIRQRLLCRRVDPVTGAVYNVTGKMPTDQRIRARLERRADDCEAVIEQRLRVYEERMPGVRQVLKAHGVDVVRVHCGGSAEEVAEVVRKSAAGKRVVIAGAPGCGKGTQGTVLARDLGVEHVSTGDLLRRAARLASEGVALVADDDDAAAPDGVVVRL